MHTLKKLLMRAAHKVRWHYSVPVSSHPKAVRDCEWCGALGYPDQPTIRVGRWFKGKR